MKIEKVKEFTDTYLINNSITVSKLIGATGYNDVQDWIANGGIIEPEFTDSELLQNAKDKKIAEIKALRNSNLLKSTPQTITYSGNLENKTFNISEGDANVFATIIGKLQRQINAGVQNPTRNWSDASGERLSLSINDFESLADHLELRDEQEFDQARLKTEAIKAMNLTEDSIEETIQEVIERIEDFDINEVIV